jgi:hypothetical protein
MDLGLISTIDQIIENFKILPKNILVTIREKKLVAMQIVFSFCKNVVTESCFGCHKV